MRKIQIGAALFAALAFSVIAVASASAVEPQWLVNSAVIPAGGSVEVDSKTVAGSPLLLEDMAQGVDVLCEGSGTGLVLPAGKDEQLTATCTNPLVDAGTCGSPKVEAVHLKWLTQLLEPEVGVFVDDITTGTGGNPGWLVECTVLGVKIDDECTTAGGSTLVTNEANGTVDVEFMEEQTEAFCSFPKTEKGLVVGLIILEALEGGVLVPLAVSLA